MKVKGLIEGFFAGLVAVFLLVMGVAVLQFFIQSLF